MKNFSKTVGKKRGKTERGQLQTIQVCTAWFRGSAGKTMHLPNKEEVGLYQIPYNFTHLPGFLLSLQLELFLLFLALNGLVLLIVSLLSWNKEVSIYYPGY